MISDGQTNILKERLNALSDLSLKTYSCAQSYKIVIVNMSVFSVKIDHFKKNFKLILRKGYKCTKKTGKRCMPEVLKFCSHHVTLYLI